MKNFAVIKSGGKQYKISEGSIIEVEKLNTEKGTEIKFKEVLLISNEGDKIKLGVPLIKGAEVTGTVLGHNKGKKVSIIKFKSKKRYKRKYGHRQLYTKVQIKKISG